MQSLIEKFIIYILKCLEDTFSEQKQKREENDGIILFLIWKAFEFLNFHTVYF